MNKDKATELDIAIIQIKYEKKRGSFTEEKNRNHQEF